METKQALQQLIEELPQSQIYEVASFIAFIKKRDENKAFKDLETLSMSGTDFWDNDIDDEAWNDV